MTMLRWKDFIILSKTVFYYRFTFDSVELLDEMTKKYVNWYNKYVRPHSYNDYLTPMEKRYT